MMSRFIRSIPLLATVALAAQPVAIHVAPGGNDTGAGTASQPFQSIARAIEQARRHLDTGAVVALAGGEYRGGITVRDLRGRPERPIVLQAADPNNPPRIVGGGVSFHFAGVSWLELRGLVITGQTGNGINLDDAGDFGNPSRHIVLERLTITAVGPTGNRDAIKLSGVRDFVVRDCVLKEWGDGGSGIDMVGCGPGVIEGCTFTARPTGGSNAVQMKGGTRDVLVRRNRFLDAGARAINIGGSTGLQFFRPKVEGFEAKDIRVEGNLFVGATAPVAFVGVDGATVRFNTFHLPGRWVMRILQETTAAGFVPCRAGVFTDNIVVFRSDMWSEGGCNIGPNTAPDTFRFARNAWFCTDRPEASRPTLPTAETDGIYGLDPGFVAPERGDFSLRPSSPAKGKGHTAMPAGDAPAADPAAPAPRSPQNGTGTTPTRP